jgi:hypothetical protein
MRGLPGKGLDRGDGNLPPFYPNVTGPSIFATARKLPKSLAHLAVRSRRVLAQTPSLTFATEGARRG